MCWCRQLSLLPHFSTFVAAVAVAVAAVAVAAVAAAVAAVVVDAVDAIDVDTKRLVNYLTPMEVNQQFSSH